jgi:hypothetical protein
MAWDLSPLNAIIKIQQIRQADGTEVRVPVIILQTFPDGGVILAPVNTFQTLFAEAASFTHAALSAQPAARAGWQQYLDDWKVKGWIV